MLHFPQNAGYPTVVYDLRFFFVAIVAEGCNVSAGLFAGDNLRHQLACYGRHGDAVALMPCLRCSSREPRPPV